MASYSQNDQLLDNASLDAMLSVPPQTNFDLGSLSTAFTGIATPPEEERPGDFIQRLASQNQILACLRWLGEFQVLALIPLRSSIAASEVAELANVPVLQLSRIVRMTATAGFLSEPRPGEIAHTTLSARFVTDLSFFDAIMFLAESAAMTALQMTTATERQGRRRDSAQSAYSVAFNTTTPFRSACLEQPRLQRRYNAYARYIAATSSGFIELLARLNWRSLGDAGVVDANAESIDVATALCQWNPSLRITIQMSDAGSPNAKNDLNNPGGRFTMQRRAPAAAQPVKDATVYILRLRAASSPREQLIAELNAHLHVLRVNGSATLLLELPVVPEPGSVEPGIEATARLWDLSRSQFTNEADLEVGDLENLISSISDGNGKLVIVNKLRSRSSAAMAIGVKYESSLGGLYSATPLLA